MRVLVIEDEPRLARNIARMLREQAGYAVDISADGEDGLHMARTNPYDLIVLDLLLPKLDGISLLQQLRKEGAKAKNVMAADKAGMSTKKTPGKPTPGRKGRK